MERKPVEAENAFADFKRRVLDGRESLVWTRIFEAAERMPLAKRERFLAAILTLAGEIVERDRP